MTKDQKQENEFDKIEKELDKLAIYNSAHDKRRVYLFYGDVYNFVVEHMREDRQRILEIVKKHYLSGVRNNSDLSELERKILNP